jgi:hypothetical protein
MTSGRPNGRHDLESFRGPHLSQLELLEIVVIHNGPDHIPLVLAELAERAVGIGHIRPIHPPIMPVVGSQ